MPVRARQNACRAVSQEIRVACHRQSDDLTSLAGGRTGASGQFSAGVKGVSYFFNLRDIGSVDIGAEHGVTRSGTDLETADPVADCAVPYDIVKSMARSVARLKRPLVNSGRCWTVAGEFDRFCIL